MEACFQLLLNTQWQVLSAAARSAEELGFSLRLSETGTAQSQVPLFKNCHLKTFFCHPSSSDPSINQKPLHY